MKKTILLMSMAIALFAGDIAGEYVVISVESNGKKEASFMEVGFSKDGNLMIMGMPAGKWTCDKSKQIVSIESVFDTNGAEENKIVKQSDNLLVLKSKSATTTYRKLDNTKIEKENKTAPFLGGWKVLSSADNKVTLSFTLPNIFIYEKIDTKENSTENVKGKWIYDKKDHSIIVMTIGSPFAGENKILKTEDNSLELSNKTNRFKLIKQ